MFDEDMEEEIMHGLFAPPAVKQLLSERKKSFGGREYLMLRKGRGRSVVERVLFCLREEKMGMDVIARLPYGVSLPLLEILRYARQHTHEVDAHSVVVQEQLGKLIGREDVARNIQTFFGKGEGERRSNIGQLERRISMRRSLPFERGTSNVFLQPDEEEKTESLQILEKNADAQTYLQNIERHISHTFEAGSMRSGEDPTGTGSAGEGAARLVANRFSQDMRFREVSQMLDSSKHIKLRLEKIAEFEQLSDEKLE